PEKAGAASGMLSMSRMLGGTFGVAAGGALFQHLSSDRLAAKLSGLHLTAAQRSDIAAAMGTGRSKQVLAGFDPHTSAQVGAAMRQLSTRRTEPDMAVDVANVSEIGVEPGTLPETMSAWVIRREREGEPRDAFQLEEIEVPEPGAFEVVVRVMAAGVNYNNVWAALGKPVSVFGYGDHPEYGHHIGGSDASGIVWKVGAGVTRWKPGDEVVIHCNQASY